MPPKAAPPLQHPPASPSPPPTASGGDAQDLLIIQDFMDTLDQVPLELTKVHADLNELGAVLYSTLVNLEVKLNQLVEWIQDASVGPEKRFQLLQEIAEEAARYKLGGDDKIRVAGGACDGIMAHQKHITNLLNASTLLNPAPPSPYTQSLTLSLPTISNTRRGQLARAANSPFGGRGYATGSGVAGEKVGDTPTKKKKSRVQQLGKDDDDASSVGGPKKTAPKKRRPVNRATSPADSIGSASAFTSNKVEPRTARQLAAAANKARKAEREVESDESGEEGINPVAMQVTPSQDSIMDRRDVGLGLEFGHSRETTGATNGRASATATPLLAQAAGIPGDKARNGQRPRGMKRMRGDEENGEGSDEDDGNKPPAKRSGNGKKASGVGGADEPLGEMANDDPAGDGGWESEQVYCVCRGVSFGEMIGCDNDDCELEWFHLSCVGLDKTPEGSWFCPACTEKKKNGGKVKRPAAKSRRK